MVNDYRAIFRSALYEKKPLMRFVLLHIALQQKPETGCYVSADEMAAGLGISRRTVFRALAQAEADGLLRKQSERDHRGHVVTQRWVMTEKFKATERESRVPDSDTRAECHTDTTPSVTEDKAECQTTQSRVPSSGTGLRNTLISKSIMKSMIGKSADSAQIETITINNCAYSYEEWKRLASQRNDFGTDCAQVTFADGKTISARIRTEPSGRLRLYGAA